MSLESIAGPLIGGGLGLLSGGGESGPTVTRPYIPKDRDDAYTRQLKDALKLYETQFDPRPTMRVANTYPTNQFEGLFRNPELGELQRRSDQTFFESLLQPQDKPATAAPVDNTAALADLEARIAAKDYLKQAAGTKGYGWMNQSAYDDTGLADVGRFVMAANKTGGGMFDMGAIDARQQNPELADKFDAANAAMRLELMRRKGMGA